MFSDLEKWNQNKAITGKEGLYERLRRWSDQYRQDGRTGQVKVYNMKTGGSLLKPGTHSVLVLLQGTSILVDSH